MAKAAQKATIVGHVDIDIHSPSTCPKDQKKMIATKVVRHEGRSGMFWVCECGYMAPIR